MKRKIQEIEELYSGQDIDPWGVDWRGSMQLRNNFYTNLLLCSIDKYLINSSQKLSILEIGCGSGVLTEIIANKLENRFIKYIATDISSNAIEKAKKNQKNKLIEYTRLDSNLLNSSLGKFDLVICIEMIVYLDDEEKRIFLENIKKLSNENSILFITSNISSNKSNELVYIFDSNLRKLIQEENLKIHFYKDLFISQYVNFFEQYLLFLIKKMTFLSFIIKPILKSKYIPLIFDSFLRVISSRSYPVNRNRAYLLTK